MTNAQRIPEPTTSSGPDAEGTSAGLLTVAPCIGTDQMGPKRFGDAGRLAFSYGNVAQDEGAALAELANEKGWKTANVVTDKAIVPVATIDLL